MEGMDGERAAGQFFLGTPTESLDTTAIFDTDVKTKKKKRNQKKRKKIHCLFFV
jgi:hypothetical protein